MKAITNFFKETEFFSYVFLGILVTILIYDLFIS
jgi:VanZ family protein